MSRTDAALAVTLGLDVTQLLNWELVHEMIGHDQTLDLNIISARCN